MVGPKLQKKKEERQPGKSAWIIDANGNKVKNPDITDTEAASSISDVKQDNLDILLRAAINYEASSLSPSVLSLAITNASGKKRVKCKAVLEWVVKIWTEHQAKSIVVTEDFATVNLDFSMCGDSPATPLEILNELKLVDDPNPGPDPAPLPTIGEWSKGTLPSKSAWSDMAWNGQLFCAVASGTPDYATSPDGLTWTKRTLPVAALSSPGICWNGTIFVLMGQYATGIKNHAFLTSPDGLTWTKQADGESVGLWKRIAWNGQTFCAIGVGRGDQGCYASTDGIKWMPRNILDLNKGRWTDIIWTGKLFCAVFSEVHSKGTFAVTSPNGSTWSVSQLSMAANSVAWNGKVLCAITATALDTAVAVSSDGLVWTTYAKALPVGSWSRICWTGKMFCATTTGNSNLIAFSFDGVSWATKALPVAGNWDAAVQGKALCLISTASTDALVLP